MDETFSEEGGRAMDSGTVSKAIEYLNDIRQLFRIKPEWLIDTIDVAVKCCQKQFRQEPEIGYRLDGDPMPVCPNCKVFVDCNYCATCGQKIDWQEGE